MKLHKFASVRNQASLVNRDREWTQLFIIQLVYLQIYFGLQLLRSLPCLSLRLLGYSLLGLCLLGYRIYLRCHELVLGRASPLLQLCDAAKLV